MRPGGRTDTRRHARGIHTPAPAGCGGADRIFAGRRRAFTLPLAPEGTPFQRAVWDALRTIPYGESRSYKQIAAQIGRPTACRAVGMANNRNPIAIVVPCHRVVGSGGTLVGYAGGLETKAYLLGLERENKG